jgi:hypothetical protein
VYFNWLSLPNNKTYPQTLLFSPATLFNSPFPGSKLRVKAGLLRQSCDSPTSSQDQTEKLLSVNLSTQQAICWLVEESAFQAKTPTIMSVLPSEGSTSPTNLPDKPHLRVKIWSMDFILNIFDQIFSLKNQEYITKAQVYIQIFLVVAVSSYLRGFLGSTNTFNFANIPYIIHWPEFVHHFPELFIGIFGKVLFDAHARVPWLVDSASILTM